MKKLYDKIYPVEPYEEDNKIFQQTIRLQWVELKHFIKTKNILEIGAFIQNFNYFLKELDFEHSWIKKLFYVTKIFDLTKLFIEFNRLNNTNDLQPYLIFGLIQSQPLRLFSNLKFIELYIDESSSEFSLLKMLLKIGDLISNINYSKLIDVSKEEFIKKCNESASEPIEP